MSISNDFIQIINGFGTLINNILDTVKKHTSHINDIIQINVEDFPLILPEIDDTARIQRAITSLGSKQGIVLFPKSLYNISNTIVLPNDNIILKGNGWNTNIILNGGKTLFYALEKGGIQIKDMYIADGSTSRTEWTIHFKNCRNIKIDNVLLTGQVMTISDVSGIYFEKDTLYTNSFTNRILNCQLRSSSVKIESSDSYVLFSEIWGNNRDFAVHLVKSEQFLIGCQIVPGITKGIYLKDTKDNYDIEDIKISDVYFDGSYSGVVTGIGLVAEKLKYSSIVGCDFWHLKDSGAHFVGNCYGNTIIGNKFNDCDYNDLGLTDIKADDLNGCTISNNIFNRGTRTNKGKVFDILTNSLTGNLITSNHVWSTSNYLVSTFGTFDERFMNRGIDDYRRRTNVETYFATSASAIVGTETQIIFDTENIDTLNELSSGTFTATRTGKYLISSFASFGAIPTGTRMILNIRKNNANKVRLNDMTYSGASNGNITIGNSVQLNLNAGDTIKIYYYTSQACNLAGGEIYTNLRIMEIA